jgi:S-DNA-T family DNA segregation ATPase FtsK/SpoIIIE
VELRRPPDLPAAQPVNPLTRLLAVVMLVAVGGMAAVYLRSGQGTPRNPMFLLFPVMMLASATGTLAHTFRGRTAEVNAARCGYLRYLDDIVHDTTETARRQHDWLHWRHPDPAALWTLAGGPRMWERRPGDPDFGVIRFGLGPVPLATPLIAPQSDSLGDTDPVTEGALQEVLERWALLADVPVTLALAESGRTSVHSDPEVSRNVLRAMLCQLATLHSPTDVRIAAVVPPGDTHWDWLKWLPHHRDSLLCDGAGPRRLTFTDLAAAQDACAALGAAQVVIVVDGVDTSGTAVTAGVAVFDIAAAAAVITVGCRPDELGPGQAARCARRIAGYAPDGGSAGRPGWPDLIGVASGHFDPAEAWRPRADEDRLRVPIGFTTTTGERGQPVVLDIKEAAHGGMGPHGLCIGATGSGKSEFLRTLILGLVATHAPDELNLALIDFKGGATFLGLDRAAHVAAVITNLADEAHLVERMRDALTGEMNRRQELLRAAGNLAGVHDYRRARAAGADLPALPVLFIVVDEFSELLSQQPDFADLFVAIGRVGRSLGMHLLLASQRFDEGRMRGLDTHLSYRICLRTFSTGESRAVLGTPDAYQLPAAPGAAYLRTPTGETVRFHTAYVSGLVSDPLTAAAPGAVLRPFTAAPVPDRAARRPGAQSTLLDSVLDRMAGHGTPAHQVWLPPLDRSPSLGDLLRAPGTGPLRIPVGLVDNAFAQRHDPLLIDLTGATGHAAVVGATQSGKSTALCTIVLGLAATRAPAAVQCYLLDFGGGALAPLGALPHIGVYAGRADAELAQRAVRHLHDLLRRREANLPDDQGEVFLVVDGWAALRQVCDGLEDGITALAAHGLAHGIHVVVAASRWAELRPALKDQLGTRIELRLGEPAESETDRRRARLLTGRGPGACLTRDGLFSVIARPTLFGLDTAAAVQALRARHGDAVAPRIQALPDMLTWPDGPPAPPATGSGVIPIGVGESAMHTVAIDFAEHQHLIVLGDIGCGKTATLRTLCLALTRSGGPRDVQLLIVDYRRSLLGVVQSGHLAGYAISADAVQSRLDLVLAQLRGRRPGVDVTQRQLRDRSWWSGPDIYLVIDDYDLVAAASGNPLGPLLEYLPHARDLGLHVIVARRSGGAARALFDPLLAGLRELGSAGLMMSAGPEEGVLLGSARPVRLPPGRATLSVRGAPDERIQIAWADPP